MIGLHLIHEVTSPQAFADLEEKNEQLEEDFHKAFEMLPKYKQKEFANIVSLNSQEIWGHSMSFIIRVLLGSFLVGGCVATITGVTYYHASKQIRNR